MKYLISSLLLIIIVSAQAQTDKNSELYKTLAKKDSLLFTEGLNKCNVDLITTLIHSDFEFYHDKGGINPDKEDFVSGLRISCANNDFENKRILVENSLQVYPMYENGELYGAVQTGEHKFGDSQPKFSHLWLIENNEWRISRVFSYDH